MYVQFPTMSCPTISLTTAGDLDFRRPFFFCSHSMHEPNSNVFFSPSSFLFNYSHRTPHGTLQPCRRNYGNTYWIFSIRLHICTMVQKRWNTILVRFGPRAGRFSYRKPFFLFSFSFLILFSMVSCIHVYACAFVRRDFFERMRRRMGRGNVSQGLLRCWSLDIACFSCRHKINRCPLMQVPNNRY